MACNFVADPLKFECSLQVAYKISNVAQFMSGPSGTKRGIADHCDGWQLDWKATEEGGETYLALYLTLPEKRSGTTIDLSAELRHLDGSLLQLWTWTREFASPRALSWGSKKLISQSALLDKNPRVKEDNAFMLLLNIRTEQAPVYAPRPAPSFLSASQAINASLTSPADQRDLKFLSFNSRPVRNQGDHVRESFASSHLLAKHTAYFSSHAAFAEGTSSMDQAPDSMPKFEASYDYLSDSDLDSESESEDEQGEEEEEKGQEEDDDKAENKEEQEASDDDDDKSGEKSREKSDSQSSHSSDDSGLVKMADPANAFKKWKVIMLGDIAHKTWLATLGFLYTNVIRFAPLSTKGANNEAYDKQEKVAFPEASCKSIFRVADKMGIKVLEDHAFNFLKSQMDDDTIFHELFSSFTAKYDRLKDMECEYLFANWNRLKTSAVLKTMLDEVASGKRPESVWLLPRVFVNPA